MPLAIRNTEICLMTPDEVLLHETPPLHSVPPSLAAPPYRNSSTAIAGIASENRSRIVVK
jgi:hypothetical protein